MFCFLQNRLSSYHRMASPAKKTAEERQDIAYDPEESESEAGRPKKGRKKKETPDPGLTMVKVLPWVLEGAGGLGVGKTSGAGTRGVDLNAAVGGRTGYTDTNGGESSNNGSKIHADCYPAENPSL